MKIDVGDEISWPEILSGKWTVKQKINQGVFILIVTNGTIDLAIPAGNYFARNVAQVSPVTGQPSGDIVLP